jgi:hypothetical protein
MLIQNGSSALTTQDLHRCDVHPGRFEFAGDDRDLRVLGQQAHHVVGGPVIEVIDVDLGVIHIAAPTRAVPA